MDAFKLLNSLSDSNWYTAIVDIERSLKTELQGSKGFIRQARSKLSEQRNAEFDEMEQKFLHVGLDDLDNAVNDLASKMLKYNNQVDINLQYDLINSLSKFKNLSKYPFLSNAVSFLSDSSNDINSLRRLTAAIHEVANQSLSQSRKSNAGIAGERIVRAILLSVGLLPSVHYREQYKSKKGSDTDFAFPLVDDYCDSKLEVLVAVQMSTNDRARLTSSELKHGVISYVLTGNGLDASSKSLDSIGSQIIETYQQSNIRLVCFAPEIEKEKRRLLAKIKTSNSEVDARRLEYFKSSAYPFREFAKAMQRFSL